MTEPSVILVVDDVRSNVHLISGLLKKDYRILKAYGGAEALEIYRREKPDLVLLDIGMPDIDGLEVCRQIKSNGETGFVPVIFLTARDDLKSREEGMMAGAEDFISKPVEVAELKARIKALLRTKNLYQELARANQEIERERDVIARIQSDMLPKAPPKIPGFGFFSEYRPSSKAGGDYYDFIRIDEDHLGIVICDVAGHGPPAAVIMAMTRIVLRAYLSKTVSPRETLEKLNEILCEHIQTPGFISAFYGVINLSGRTMKYASAGHNPPLLLDYEKGRFRELTCEKGFPLKISANNPMTEYEASLPRRGKLALYTDGITEAMNPGREVFGRERFAAALLELGKNWSAEQLGRAVMKIICDFQGRDKFDDDYTLVIMEIF